MARLEGELPDQAAETCQLQFVTSSETGFLDCRHIEDLEEALGESRGGIDTWLTVPVRSSFFPKGLHSLVYGRVHVRFFA